MHDYAELLAVFHELAGLLDARALLDVLEDLWIARLETHNQQAASGILHRLERFVVGVNSRGARPRRLERLQLFTHGDRAVLRPRERVIIEENLLKIGKLLPRSFDFCGDVLGTACPPGVPADRLRPQAERAQRRTAARGVERDVRIEQEGHVIPGYVEVPLVYV